MADSLDEAQVLTEIENASLIYQARKAARSIPVGEPGVCDECGDESLRLVGKRCAPCRDGR